MILQNLKKERPEAKLELLEQLLEKKDETISKLVKLEYDNVSSLIIKTFSSKKYTRCVTLHPYTSPILIR